MGWSSALTQPVVQMLLSRAQNARGTCGLMLGTVTTMSVQCNPLQTGMVPKLSAVAARSRCWLVLLGRLCVEGGLWTVRETRKLGKGHCSGWQRAF